MRTLRLEVAPRRGAGDAVRGEEVALQRIELVEGARGVVARAVGQPRSRRQLRLHLQPVVGAVGLEIGALEGEQVGDAGPLEHPVERVAQVVGVLEQLAARLVGHHEEGPLAARPRLLVVARPQPSDVDRLDHAVGAAELVEHPVDVPLQAGVAEALVAVHEVGLAEGHVVGVLRRLGIGGVAAEQQPAVEPLGEEDDLLAPLDGVERLGHLGERARVVGDAAHLERALLLLGGEGDRLQVVVDLLLLEVVPLVAPLARRHVEERDVGLVDDEAQRVGPPGPERLVVAERVDRPRELHAVGGEGDDQLGAGLQRIGGHRREVARMERIEHEVARGHARLEDRRRRGEGEVEQQQEMAPRRRAQLRRLLEGGRAALRDGRPHRLEIDHLEGGELLLLVAVVDLEVVGGQPAHRLAVAADDVDRHLHGDHLGAAFEGRGLGHRRQGRERGDEDQQKAGERGMER